MRGAMQASEPRASRRAILRLEHHLTVTSIGHGWMTDIFASRTEKRLPAQSLVHRGSRPFAIRELRTGRRARSEQRRQNRDREIIFVTVVPSMV